MKFLITSIFILFLAGISFGQKVEVDQSFIDDSNRAFTEVVALRAENAVNLKAIEDLKTEINKLHIDLAVAITEKTDAQNANIQLRADFQFLLANGRSKQWGLFNVRIGGK